MQPQTVLRILRKYGYDGGKVLPPEKGYRNESYPVILPNGGMINVILYKREPGTVDLIHRVHDVSKHLHDRQLPIRYPLDERIVAINNGATTRYAAIYNYLPGETISWEAYTQKHLKLLGKTMSDVHRALRDYPAGKLPRVTGVYIQIYTRMRRYWAGDDVRVALAGKLGLSVPNRMISKMDRLLGYCEALPGQQAVHMDFVRSNVLFARDDSSPFGLQVSGILDLEKAAYGHPIFDIARTYAFLLVDCKYKTPDKIRKYFLYSGYHKRGAQELDRLSISAPDGGWPLLEHLTDMFLLYDFYKFLRHNPYEYLPTNEHFVRTKNLLLERGVITTTSVSGAR